MKRATLQMVITAMFLAFSIVSPAVAYQYSNQAAILHLGTGARAAGLGGAFLPLADDESAAFYNPAGLGWEKRISVSSYFSQAYGVLAYGTIGISFPYLGAELMRLESGWIQTDSGGFSYVSQCGVAGIGFAIGPVGFGMRFKVYQVESPYTGFGWALDPAVLIATDNLRIGLMLENAVSQTVEYSTGTSGEWAMGLDVGVAFQLRPSNKVKWSIAFVATGLFSPDPEFSAGIEGWVGGLGVRAGLDPSGPSMGLSVRFSEMRIDLSYRESGELGGSYGASVTYSF